MMRGFSYPSALSSRILLALLVSLPLASAFTQGTLHVRPGEPRVSARGGSVLSAAIIVTNTSRTRATITPRLDLPQGWRQIIRDPQFSLEPDQTDTRLISVSIPAGVRSGMYRVGYKAVIAGSPASETSIDVSIDAVRELRLSLVSAPRFVVAGQEYTITVALTNAGNETAAVRLTARSSEGFVVRLDSTRVLLSIGEVREIQASVRSTDVSAVKISSTTEVVAAFMEDSTAAARLASIIDIIPEASGSKAPMVELPVDVTGRLSGQDDRMGGQIEVAGFGSFTESGRDRIDFLVRTPDGQSQSSLGLRDEYRIRYAFGGAEIALGDGNYSLSPLTELNRYAFGGRARYSTQSISAGGFYNESRYLPGPFRQYAGFADVRVADGYQIGLNYLKKEEQQSSEISSLRGQWNFHRLLRTDLEYAVSRSGGSEGAARAVTLTGRQQWLAYDLRHIRAGSLYTGYYRDLDYTSMGVTISPAPLFRLESYFRIEERNIARDTSRGIAPREQLIQIGAGFSNLAVVYYRVADYEDLLPTPLYKRKEQMVQVRLGTVLDGVSLFSNIDIGSISDQLQKRSFPFQRYSIFSGFSPDAHQSYTASVEFSSERNLFTGEPLQRLSGSLGASYSVTAATVAHASLFVSRTKSSGVQDFGLLEGGLQHSFPNQHRVSVRARQVILTASPLREVAYVLQYGIPLNIPVSRTSSAGQVSGRIAGETGRGIPGILVTVGSSAAVTDRNGDFMFPSIPPGRHYLLIDRGTTGLEFITRQPLPLALDVRGGEETRVILDGTRSSAISAVVEVYAFGEGDSSDLHVSAGVPKGVTVEAVRDQEVLRRVPDSRGQVDFTDLRPGIWTIRLQGELPRFHSLEQESFELNVGPGRHEEARFRVIPRRRPIRILQEAEVVAQPAPSTDEPKDDCLIEYDLRQKGFVLQVSSWVTRAKALERSRVAERLTRLNATIERTNVPGKGIRYRVKVSPFRTREDAVEACKELTRLENQE